MEPINFEDLYKYPSTPHHPSSPSVQSDDKVIGKVALAGFLGEDVVIGIKKDGENTSGYWNGHVHARSLDSRSDWTRSVVKQIMAQIHGELEPGMRLCMENCYAKHSIYYPEGYLEGYVYLLSAWKGDLCLSFDDTVEWAEYLDLPMPAVLYRGPYEEGVMEDCAKRLDLSLQEGLVLRKTSACLMSEFDAHFMKWVRPGHVQTDKHWRSNTYPNGAPKAPGKPKWLGMYARSQGEI